MLLRSGLLGLFVFLLIILPGCNMSGETVQLQYSTGYITVTSSPQGAAVFKELPSGKRTYLGNTPLRNKEVEFISEAGGPFREWVGRVNLIISERGYEDYQTYIYPGENPQNAREFEVNLTPEDQSQP